MNTRLLLVALSLASLCAFAQTNGPAKLTLERAVHLAIENSHQLREAQALVTAARERSRNVGLFPNPEAVARMESAPLQGNTTRNAEYVAGLSQTIPLGGRLTAARDSEILNVTQAVKQAELTLLQVQRNVHSAFATALFADEAARLQSNSLQDAQSALRIARIRLETGDAIPDDVARIESETLLAQVELNRAHHIQEHARRIFAAAIGTANAHAFVLEGELDHLLGISTIDALIAELKAAESLSETDLQRHEARLTLARQERIPDLNLDLFYRRLEETKRDAFDVGFRIPIPVFSRSAQKIRAARADVTAAEARLENTRLQSRL
jgi:cobalt-zinc-cadmium efflux system outer membrane protein